MRDRRFGVELEHAFPGGYTAACEYLATGQGSGNLSEEWTIRQDGSCAELMSPILKGSSGFTELRRMMRYLLAGGAFTTRMDGMHVHHDAPEFKNNKELQRKLVGSWVANQKYVNSFVARERVGSDMCPTWHAVDVPFVNGDDYSGYKDLRFALSSHGTIELRLHEGCLDFDRAEAWIRFGQAFINKVSNEARVLPTADDHADLLRRLRVAQKARESLSERASVAV